MPFVLRVRRFIARCGSIALPKKLAQEDAEEENQDRSEEGTFCDARSRSDERVVELHILVSIEVVSIANLLFSENIGSA